MASFGVAGNFTGHLEQAGEATDFINVKADSKTAPKALFPTYMPSASEKIPSNLSEFPFDSQKIIYPKGEQKIQLEPECAIICSVEWDGTKIKNICPKAFGASNDCSIRKEGARKISQKKNWGASSKGLADNLIDIDKFTKGGILDDYRIASFLVRTKDGTTEIFDYGEDSPVSGYSYIYEQLEEWIVRKLNTQADEGPAENVNSYLNEAGRPEQIMVSIGATRYTSFGETNFLHDGDKSAVILYPQSKYSHEQIAEFVRKGEIDNSRNPDTTALSVLVQTVVNS